MDQPEIAHLTRTVGVRVASQVATWSAVESFVAGASADRELQPPALIQLRAPGTSTGQTSQNAEYYGVSYDKTERWVISMYPIASSAVAAIIITGAPFIAPWLVGSDVAEKQAGWALSCLLAPAALFLVLVGLFCTLSALAAEDVSRRVLISKVSTISFFAVAIVGFLAITVWIW